MKKTKDAPRIEGDAIKAAIDLSGYRYVRLSEELGITQAAVSNMVSDGVIVPTVVRLADIIGISIYDLMGHKSGYLRVMALRKQALEFEDALAKIKVEIDEIEQGHKPI